jgi:hypothetical protein
MTGLQTNAYMTNPFDAARDADRHELWQILVARDSDAFAAGDWSVCDGDFAHAQFEGVSAHGSADPVDWTLRYPTVDSYRDEWLGMAKTFAELPLTTIPHRGLLYKMQSFAKVEIAEGRAIVWKQFRADEPLADGGRYMVSAQSVYRMRSIDGKWKIVGFVGYLPLQEGRA